MRDRAERLQALADRLEILALLRAEKHDVPDQMRLQEVLAGEVAGQAASPMGLRGVFCVGWRQRSTVTNSRAVQSISATGGSRFPAAIATGEDLRPDHRRQ